MRMTGVFVIALDVFNVNAALPPGQLGVGASASPVEWVVAGYVLVFAVFLVASCRVGSRIRRRAILLINVSIGVIALALVPRTAPASRVEQANRLDTVGMALVTVALLGTVLPLIEGKALRWSAGTWDCFGGLAVSAASLCVHHCRLAARGGAPLFEPVLFQSATLRSGLSTRLGFSCSQASLILVLSLYLQEGRGVAPIDAGLEFTILAASYLAVSLPAPALRQRFGPHFILVGGPLVAVGAVALCLFRDNFDGGPLGLVALGLVLVGVGQGLVITPPTSTVFSHAAAQNVGAISGALPTMQPVGKALAVAITGVVLYGALAQGYLKAFGRSFVELVILMAEVAPLTRRLPGPGVCPEARGA